MTIGSGSPSLNDRRLHRDCVSGRGFSVARVKVLGAQSPFCLLSQIWMISEGNFGDSGGLLHSSDLFHQRTQPTRNKNYFTLHFFHWNDFQLSKH